VVGPDHRTPHAPNMHYSDTLQGSKETTMLLHNHIRRHCLFSPRKQRYLLVDRLSPSSSSSPTPTLAVSREPRAALRCVTGQFCGQSWSVAMVVTLSHVCRSSRGSLRCCEGCGCLAEICCGKSERCDCGQYIRSSRHICGFLRFFAVVAPQITAAQARK